MEKLEGFISKWRKTLAGSVDAETLNELECHLREEAELLARSGMEEREAFRVALDKLGNGEKLAAEFQKVKQGRWWALTIICWLAGLLVVAMGGLFGLRIAQGKMSALLGVHVFSVTAGYSAVLFSGLLGFCYVGERYLRGLNKRRTQAGREVMFIFTATGFILTGVGIVLGSVWAKLEWGRYWAWDPKEVAALLLWVWCGVFLIAQKCRLKELAVMQWSVAGNLIFCVSLFGPAFWAAGSFDHPVLFYACVLAGMHIAGLAISFLPAKSYIPSEEKV